MVGAAGSSQVANVSTAGLIYNATSNALSVTGNVTGGNIITSGAVSSTGTIVGLIQPRVSSTASASSVTPDITSYDIYAFNALAAALTINAPSGSPADGVKLTFRILDNGSSQTLTWNATYTAIGVTLPGSTTANKTTYVGCIYNANAARWDVIAVTTQL